MCEHGTIGTGVPVNRRSTMEGAESAAHPNAGTRPQPIIPAGAGKGGRRAAGALPPGVLLDRPGRILPNPGPLGLTQTGDSPR